MKNGICHISSIFLFCIALLGPSIDAQGQSYQLLGQVTDTNGDAVAGALIVIEGPEPLGHSSVTTGRDGSFRMEQLTAGDHSITVSADGFKTQRYQIAIPTAQRTLITLQPGSIAAEISVATSFLAGSPESLAEVPGSIDRIDARTLEATRAFNFSEALRKLPGVNVRDEEGFGLRPNIGIRGTNPTRSTKVLLLEDGIPLAYAPYGDNASYYHPPIERYESIEVLKGSSQIAYGPQTIAGVINYVTPNPTRKPSFTAAVTGGNMSYLNGSFAGSGTIGRTGIFAHYTRKQGDGSRENTHSNLNDLTAKVVHELNERNVLTFKGSYYGEDSNVTYSGLTADEYAADPRSNPFKNDFFFGDRYGFSASHTAVLSTYGSLTTNGYYNKFSRDWWRQSSNSAQRPNRLNVDPDCRSMADLSTTCGIEGRLRDYQTYGIEPRLDLHYNAGTAYRGDLQAGFRLHWETQDRRQLNGDLPTSRDGVAVEINRRKNFAQSAYVQHRFVIRDLAITPGIRLERIEIDRQNLLASPIATGRTVIHAIIPGVGIAYSGLPRTTVFAGVHRGFSPPRAEDIIGNNGGVVDLEPEQSWNYEAGVRSRPVTGIQFEATAFSLNYDNQIVAASLAGGVGSLLTNGGRTLQQGAELSTAAESAPIFGSRHNLYFRAAFTLLPVAEFRGVRFSSITPAVGITGNRLPYTPETQATYSIGYSHAKGVNAFAENVYIGGQFADDLNSIAATANGQRGYIDSQSYWNATANYATEKLKTTFFITVKNIGDKTLIVDRSRGILPSMGRTVQVGMKLKL